MYCKQCGSKLIEELVGAEKHLKDARYGASRPYSKYMDTTGERLYVVQLRCPNKRWFNGHTKYTLGNAFTLRQYEALRK